VRGGKGRKVRGKGLEEENEGTNDGTGDVGLERKGGSIHVDLSTGCTENLSASGVDESFVLDIKAQSNARQAANHCMSSEKPRGRVPSVSNVPRYTWGGGSGKPAQEEKKFQDLGRRERAEKQHF